jgi:hypothetical protein
VAAPALLSEENAIPGLLRFDTSVAIELRYRDNVRVQSTFTQHLPSFHFDSSPVSKQEGNAMGARMIEDDIYIGTFLDLFNVRFAPTPFSINPETAYGGIDEMANLQEEFKIFKPKRPFSESAALLGLGGIYSARAKNRWLDLLRNLPEDGDQKIADALVANFKRKQPLPCYMRAHDLRTKGENKVVIAESDDPLFYLEQEYLTISLPMAPKPRETGKKAKKKK